MSCTLKRTRTLANGKCKEYVYKTIGNIPIQQYNKHRYTPHKKTPKYQTLPQAMKDEILRLRSHRLGSEKIWVIINDDPRFRETPIGERSIRKLIKQHQANA